MTTARDIALVRAALEAAARLCDGNYEVGAETDGHQIRALDPAAIAATVLEERNVSSRNDNENHS